MGSFKVILDLDDFSLENNNLYFLDQLKRVYPQLKVSLFYIPFDVAYFMTLKDVQRKEVLQMVKDRLDWIELIPHGLTHKEAEFLHVKDDNYEPIFEAVEEAYKTYDLPLVKGFKAPQWLYKQNLVDYLNKKGWWMAVDKNQPEAPRTKIYYEYSHSIDEPIGKQKDGSILKLHGHISKPSANDLPSNIGNLLNIPTDAQFMFISEYLAT